MQLTSKDHELIATLADIPAFHLLVALFKDWEADVLSTVSKTGPDEELIRRTRLYQTVRTVREFLESRPLLAFEELKRQQAQRVEESDSTGKSMNQLLYERFVANRPQDEEPV